MTFLMIGLKVRRMKKQFSYPNSGPSYEIEGMLFFSGNDEAYFWLQDQS